MYSESSDDDLHSIQLIQVLSAYVSTKTWNTTVLFIYQRLDPFNGIVQFSAVKALYHFKMLA